MFILEKTIPHPQGLYDIVANYSSLLNDGDNDLLFFGTNTFGSKVLGAIVYEDDENLYIRNLHVLVSDLALQDFLSNRITLRKIIEDNGAVFIVDRNYNSDIKQSALISLSDFPNEFLPLENSYCPAFVKQKSLGYKFSMKGGLADLHKAEPLAMSDTNSKAFQLLQSSTDFLHDFAIIPRIFSEVALAGSFELNFEIELIEAPNLFSRPTDDIKAFLRLFLKYIFDTLPSEPSDILKNENASTNSLRQVFDSLKKLYEVRNLEINKESAEQKTIDLITYSVNAVKEIKYKGYDRIQLSNSLENGETIPLALINENYYSTVVDKVFLPEEINKPDVIYIDEFPKQYKIQVYSLNKETGYGGAYYVLNEAVNKIAFHLKGRTDYHGTLFSKSLDEDVSIEIKGVGKWINNKLKELTIEI